jgi:hypothetical protein
MKAAFAAFLTITGSLIFLVSAPAQSTLSFQYAGGTPLIYDSAQNVTWTQSGDVSGQTFDFADAQTWAANLSLAGVTPGGWQLPDADQFASLYSQLEGAGDKYGAKIVFGPGGEDYASNVDREYWTDTDGTDFNFYYGYPGARADDSLYPAWALTPGLVPEPSSLALGMMAGGLAVGKFRLGRRNQSSNSR